MMKRDSTKEVKLMRMKTSDVMRRERVMMQRRMRQGIGVRCLRFMSAMLLGKGVNILQ